MPAIQLRVAVSPASSLVSVIKKDRLASNGPASAGLFCLAEELNNIHLLHEERSVAVAGDAALQEIVEMQFAVVDDAFEAIVGDEPRLLECAEGEIVGREERE